jgi:O-antigen/teichoic acid export membrane protein
MLANVLSLGSLLVVTRFSGGLVLLVLAVSGTWLVVNIATAIWLFRWHKPWLAPRFSDIDLSALGTLCKVGGSFFLLQCMALVTLQTDTLVISHYLGASEVPAYSLTYNLFNYTALLQSILFSYLWAAYSEAKARGDVAWMRRTFRLSLVGGMSCTALAVIVLAAIAQPFITWWSGNHITPPTSLVHWMAVWSLIGAFVSSNACLLAGAGHLRWQTIYSAFATVTNIILSIVLVQQWGVTGVIAGTVIAYLVFICGPMIVDSELLLRRLARQATQSA